MAASVAAGSSIALPPSFTTTGRSFCAATRATATPAGALAALRANEGALAAIRRAGELLTGTFRAGGRAYSCGNGGSMCDAMHFAEEWTGRFRRDRAPLPAMAFSDPAHLTCIANDFGYEQVFARQCAALLRRGPW